MGERKSSMEKLLETLEISRREVNEVRWANQTLQADLVQLRFSPSCRNSIACPTCTAADVESSPTAGQPQQRPVSAGVDLIHAPLLGPPFAPLAPSKAAVPVWSPTRPTFAAVPETSDNTSPRLLLKTSSQPVLMPPLVWLSPENTQTQRLAPLRKLRRTPADWTASWR